MPFLRPRIAKPQINDEEWEKELKSASPILVSPLMASRAVEQGKEVGNISPTEHMNIYLKKPTHGYING